ncbi:MAG: hypothetical protein JHC38_02805 [Thiotrichales bacterium]|jgi:hypothetical protein|nr:hypothetical protein [Thiotrichales bacterium]
MANVARVGKIGVYGNKTRTLQRKLSYEALGLTFKEARFFLFQGDKDAAKLSTTSFKDKVFYEIANRSYAKDYVAIPVAFDPRTHMKTDFSRFGLVNPMTAEVEYIVHVDDCNLLGRKPVIGDVFEIPFFETSPGYSVWEIVDVDDKRSYEEYIFTLTAIPVTKSRATRDLTINSDSESVFSTLMDEADVDYASYVPTTDVNADQTTPPTSTSVRYIQDAQFDFLNDPTKHF